MSALKKLSAAYRFNATPGIRVVCERHPGALSSAVGVFVGCGSRHEPLRLHGATHLAEHLFFKGTSKHSAEEISELVERHGGEINAFTDRELTAFHAWIPVERTELALGLIFEMLFDSLFDAKEFERERHVVLQELRSYADNPDEEFADRLLEVAFDGHPLGRRIAGFEKRVKGFTHTQLSDHVAERFLRSRIVVSIVSPLGESQVKALVKKTLAKAAQWKWGSVIARKGRAPAVKAPKVPAIFSRRSEFRRFDADQVQFAFLYPAASLHDHREVAFSALANLLGGGSSSKLFREVREKRGLAYNASAQLYTYTDAGILGGYLATDPKKWIEAVAVAGETCRKLAEGVSPEDLDFIKSMMEGSVYMSYDGINNRMESLARQELLLKKPYTIEDAVKEVRRITPKEINRAAKTLLETPCFFALGPVSQRDLGRVTRAWHGGKIK